MGTNFPNWSQLLRRIAVSFFYHILGSQIQCAKIITESFDKQVQYKKIAVFHIASRIRCEGRAMWHKRTPNNVLATICLAVGAL